MVGGWGWSLTPKLHPYTLRSAEIYDPATDVWTVTTAPQDLHGRGATLTPLADGSLALIGGFSYGTVDAAAGTYSDPTFSRSVELFDPATGTWTKAHSTNVIRAGHSAVALNDGSLLVLGGSGAGDSAERGTPSALAPDETDTPKTVVPKPVKPEPTPPALPVATVTPSPTITATATPTVTATPTPVATATPVPLPARPATPVLTAQAGVHVTSTRLVLSRSGSVSLKLRCGSTACDEKIVLRLQHAVLARASFKATPGASHSIKLKLSKAARRALKHRANAVTVELTRARTVLAGTLRTSGHAPTRLARGAAGESARLRRLLGAARIHRDAVPPPKLRGRFTWVEREGTQIHLVPVDDPVRAREGHVPWSPRTTRPR